MLKQVAEEGQLSYPSPSLSVGSGFTGPELIGYCGGNGITFIGAPRKINKFQIGRYDLNLKKYIGQVYPKAGRRYLDGCKAKGIPPKPFLLRKRGHFQWPGKEVTLVFFRPNGPDKASVIFSIDLNVSAKMMRRRFFQRTKTGLSFRPLKDTLKIQTSKNTGAAPFLKKSGLAIFKAVACQNFQNYCRKHIRMSKGWAFTKLRLHLIYERIELDMLDGLAKNRGFCNF